jgi:glycosyltransferase involved in cell wall biosynthesis
MLSRVIDNFVNQTYQPSQLLVLNDADAEDISDLMPMDHPEITLVTLPPPRQNIGQKRNTAVELASGEIIIHWDDDEWHAPGRIADQVSRLLDSRKQVTGYYQFKARNDKGQMWLYSGQPMDVCGSSLCYWRAWAVTHPFGLYQVGEDHAFSSEANRLRQLDGASGTDMLTIGVHAGNTDLKPMARPPYTRIAE